MALDAQYTPARFQQQPGRLFTPLQSLLDSAHLMTGWGSLGFSLWFSLSSCSARIFTRKLQSTGQSPCNAFSTSSFFTRAPADVFGSIIWKAHHKAVRVFRVKKARSLMAAARARTSITKPAFSYLQFNRKHWTREVLTKDSRKEGSF